MRAERARVVAERKVVDFIADEAVPARLDLG
jgi:hypothetical protein